MRRYATLLPIVAATGAAAVAFAPAASAAQPADGAAYLAAQLAASGDRLTTTFDGTAYDDLGLTIDAVLALTSSRTADTQASASTDYLADNLANYVGFAPDTYAGATGKALTLASARGADPTDFGGVDLVARLQATEASSGQYTDISQWGDYSNTIGQSFGLIGLTRAGVNPSTAAVDFLLSRQCEDGGFSLDNAGACTSDPDATSLAVQALDATGGQGTAIDRAAAYLESRQETSGGVGGGTSTEAANANSTALALVAFRVAGLDDAAGAASGFLDGLTLGCDTPAVAGAIAYDQAAKSALEAQGAGAVADDQLTRSTAQALIGLSDVSYVTVTAEGAAADPVAIDCSDEPSPTTDPTTSAPSTDPSDTVTTTSATAGPSSTQPGDDPITPGVVQTDGSEGLGGVALATALGLAGLAAVSTADIVAAVRRPEGRHR